MIFPRVLLIEDNEQASLELARIGCDTRGTELMRDKYFFYAIKIPDLSCTQANIIKQEMLSIGGEAANNKGTINHSIKKTDVLLSGTLSQYKKLIKKLDLPYFNLRPLSEEMKKTIKNYSSVPPAISFKNKKLDFKKRTYIMGILNITPDSFSDGGRYFKIEDAIKKARELIGSGADIIDIGGESTRPGAEIVSEEEELKRILPAVKILAKEKKCLISVDTRKSGVAEAALKAGAHIINDISALRFDRNMAKVIAKHKAAVILMHMKNNPKTMQKNPFYKDMFGEISKHLKKGI
ncbi:dihydropteroate synthase, partial [candidate division WOR-1 bacterium RIFOXYA2_FULL_37_7]